MDLFAGVPVADYAAARDWYQRLLGAEPAFLPHETEAVWEIGEHAYLYVVEDAERAGRAIHTLFASDLEATTAAISARGIEPDRSETYENGVRKVTYRDAEGNEIGFGGAPEGDDAADQGD